MTIPFEPVWFGMKINIHLIMEYLAFFVGFRYYLWLRKRSADPISGDHRLFIVLGAAVGALVGSRLVGFLENPIMPHDTKALILLLNTKTIMGGLFGGLIGVELAKKIIGEKQSSGDLFTFPIIVGIIIGRVGCFLMGVNEFTYGKPTNSIFGMDLGDGILRHPTALYEIIFLVLLMVVLKSIRSFTIKENGLQFKIFMLSYFGWRFSMEFLKPNMFFVLGLSSIQWLCIVCWLYYAKTLKKLMNYASKKIHIL